MDLMLQLDEPGTRGPTGFTLCLTSLDPKMDKVVYHDGQLVVNETRLIKRRSTSMDRRIVVGRFSTDFDYSYTSLQMNELMFFNRPLTQAEIKMMNP